MATDISKLQKRNADLNKQLKEATVVAQSQSDYIMKLIDQCNILTLSFNYMLDKYVKQEDKQSVINEVSDYVITTLQNLPEKKDTGSTDDEN